MKTEVPQIIKLYLANAKCMANSSHAFLQCLHYHGYKRQMVTGITESWQSPMRLHASVKPEVDRDSGTFITPWTLSLLGKLVKLNTNLFT